MPRLDAREFYPITEGIANSRPSITSEMVNHFLMADDHLDAASNYIYYNRPVYAATQFMAYCKCCGLTMCSPAYIETDICDRCKELIAKEMFDPKNQNFTCNNVINIVRGKINAV